MHVFVILLSLWRLPFRSCKYIPSTFLIQWSELESYSRILIRFLNLFYNDKGKINEKETVAENILSKYDPKYVVLSFLNEMTAENTFLQFSRKRTIDIFSMHLMIC